MDLTSKKVFFLMSFGHCGVDWLHTLFDSHPEILILPEISFYRIWKIIDGDSINTYNEVFLAFLNYLENHPYRAGEENKLFSSKGKKKIFFDRFKLNLSKNQKQTITILVIGLICLFFSFSYFSFICLLFLIKFTIKSS